MRRRAVAMLVAVLATAGCAAGERSGSQTPATTTGAASALGDALLTTKALRDVPGIPAGAVVSSIDDVAVFEDRDPRGPCGAKVDPPDFSEGVAVSIRAVELNGIQFVVEPPAGGAEAMVAALVEDTRPGCPAYETETNQGVRQRVQLVRVVDLPAEVADHALATVLEISSNGRTVSAVALSLQRGSVLTFVLVISPEEFSDETVVGLGEALGRSLPAEGGRRHPA